ncbi:MAG: hypothetical protein Q4G12_10655, partial [Bacteroidales bacterium]|nr:hypothetical protein [Bacteroidales bacterium]
SFWRCHRPRKRAALGVWCDWFKLQLEIRHTATLTTGAKHWHRQKAVFYVFVSAPQFYPLTPLYTSKGYKKAKHRFNQFNPIYTYVINEVLMDF